MHDSLLHRSLAKLCGTACLLPAAKTIGILWLMTTLDPPLKKETSERRYAEHKKTCSQLARHVVGWL